MATESSNEIELFEWREPSERGAVSRTLHGFGQAFAIVVGAVFYAVLAFAAVFLLALGEAMQGLLCAVIPTVGISAAWLLTNAFNALTPRALSPMTHRLAIGIDGFVHDGLFIAWEDVDRCERTGTRSITVFLLDGHYTLHWTHYPLVVLGRLNERLWQYRQLPLPEGVGTDSMNPYRHAQRGVLVRVATNPRASIDERKNAASALKDDATARLEIEESLSEMVDGRSTAEIRTALGKQRGQ